VSHGPSELMLNKHLSEHAGAAYWNCGKNMWKYFLHFFIKMFWWTKFTI